MPLPTATPIAPAPSLLNEILTVSDVAQLLKFSKGQVYDLTRSRAKVRQTLPIPTLRINGNLRFLRSDVEKWLRQLSQEERAN
jgi:predicted DNA-binding transcriptional regulator AlpA